MTAMTTSLVDALELVPAGPGRSFARLRRFWWSWSGTHGGLLGALAVRAAQSVVATATATQARPRLGGTAYEDLPAPEAPAPVHCPDVRPPADFVPFAQQLLIRGVSGDLMFGGDRAELTAWVRWRDGRVPLDDAALVVLTDALPPALYVPRGPDVLVRTRRAAHGWCVDDCDLWDDSGVDGRVLAQSR